MTKRTIYHGTSQESYYNIIKKGFEDKYCIWNCSDDNNTYFYDLKKCIDLDCLDKNSTISRTFESAQIASALRASLGNKMYVIEVEIDDKYIEEDYSCENMDLAVCVDNEYLNKYGKIKNIYSCKYDPFIRYFVLKGIINNDYLNKLNITEQEENLIKNISEECYIDELFDFDFKMEDN